MYDELIKRLRDSEHEIDCSLCDRDCCYPNGKVHGKCIIIEAADAIEVLSKKEKTTQWIPVTERLPEDGQWVLVWEWGRFAYVDKVHNGKWMIANSNYAEIYYWMPLPEPPKEGE